MSDNKTLLYLLRRDLRVADNPILHALSKNKQGFTHVIPVYAFQPHQIEVSGFATNGNSPFEEARSAVGSFWRCGSHRAKFLAESVWDVKTGLEKLGSGLTIRVGPHGDIAKSIIEAEELNVKGLWMTEEEGSEEKQEERAVRQVCKDAGVDFRLWVDEKYLVDDRDLGKKLEDPQALPDVFTSYRKMMEPLKEVSRDVLPDIKRLPPVPKSVPEQPWNFTIPDTLQAVIEALHKPLKSIPYIDTPLPYPNGAKSAHPFIGGEITGLERLDHLLSSGAMSAYKDTRNGMLGMDFSSKLSAWLALGCITARQVNTALNEFEDGSNSKWSTGEGFGKGENQGTTAMRFELLWRDYMRLCTRKYGDKLFQPQGFRQADAEWVRTESPESQEKIQRIINGTTGMGMIDASQRELYHTGYTSNRARQNVASFLAKHLRLDWRIGAEYYEMMLVDYDVSSNWGNWQYVAGIGNDPRGEARVFNPVKQSFDYDANGEYVKMWVSEVRKLEEPAEIFQAWTVPESERKGKGLSGTPEQEAMWRNPLKRIEFTVGRRAQRRRGNGRGGANRGRGNDGGRGGRG
ncbi:DNA photolyase, FAD-binding/Cryptochrome [Calycina marina]|uniref:Cryptochrome DASH n=1 Tax=Calycina marina TaxID=1763456 RepID=A0A9P7Z261_9HELO|nr:DNA photolyase, FAD-binding/Cryptochrome [Calycina marina]